MYKALHTQTGEEIIILHPAWRSKIEALREMDRADLLVCQGCGQALRVKAGEVKRPHFAHKHLKACSLASESVQILMARAVLYEFLLGYFGDGVTLEQKLPTGGEGLPRPVDCWVETPSGSLAYWIIEAGIKIEPREAIKAALTQQGISPTWVMLHWMLNEEQRLFHSLLLSATERTFMQTTPFDEMLSATGTAGSSIHYLDAETETLTTYRNLILHHRPNWFKGLKKNSPLAQVFVDRTNGGFIHPGEEERLQTLHRRQQKLQKKRSQVTQREAAWEERLTRRDNPPPAPSWQLHAQEETEGPERLLCVDCGQMTDDYWTTFYENDRKLCRCRNCLKG